jgi:hypothetical protein
VKDAVSVANNACWAIGELAIKVSVYVYTFWFNPGGQVHQNLFQDNIPYVCLLLLRFKQFGMGFLLVHATYKLHSLPHQPVSLCACTHVTGFFCFQIGKEIEPVVISVVTCLIPILKSPEVNFFLRSDVSCHVIVLDSS